MLMLTTMPATKVGKSPLVAGTHFKCGLQTAGTAKGRDICYGIGPVPGATTKIHDAFITLQLRAQPYVTTLGFATLATDGFIDAATAAAWTKLAFYIKSKTPLVDAAAFGRSADKAVVAANALILLDELNVFEKAVAAAAAATAAAAAEAAALAPSTPTDTLSPPPPESVSKPGVPTWVWWAVGGGAAILATVAIVVVTRKKKKPLSGQLGSRAYRIAIKEGVSQVVCADDSVTTSLDILPVLEPKRMAGILDKELEKRGFIKEGEDRVRESGGVKVTVSPNGQVSVIVKESKKLDLEVTEEATADTDDDSSGRNVELKKQLSAKAKAKLADQTKAEKEALRQKATRKLEEIAREVSAELNKVSTAVVGTALKQRASEVGVVESMVEDEAGGMTIKVRLK